MIQVKDGKTVIRNYQILYFPDGVGEGKGYDFVMEDRDDEGDIDVPITFQTEQEAREYIENFDPRDYDDDGDLTKFKLALVTQEIVDI